MTPGGWPHDFPSDLFWATQEPMARADADEAALRILAAAGLEPRDAPGLRVLDVGCGRGEVAIAMADLGASVVGIDYDAERIAEALRLARDDRSGARFVVGDAAEPIPHGPYDLAFCHYTGWGYGGISMLQDTFAAVRECLAEEGVFVAETHDADVVMERFDPNLTFKRRFGDAEWTVSCFGTMTHPPDRGGIGRIDQSWSYVDPAGRRLPERRATFEPLNLTSLAMIAASTGFMRPVELDAALLGRATPGGKRLLLRFGQSPRPARSVLSDRMRDAWRAHGTCGAISDAPGVLSGRDLLDAVTRLETVLRRTGDLTGRPVAVVMPRTWAWPVALAAVRATGAIFAPIDPDQGFMRLRGILDDLRPVAVLTLESDESRLRDIVGDVPPALRMLAPGPTFEPLSVFRCHGSRELPAGVSHVFHTSGSTGTPKGVMLGEEGLLQVVDAQNALLPPAPGTSLWALGPGFDASLSDVLCPILSGRTLRVHREGATRIRALKDALDMVGVADLPPSMLHLLHAQTDRLEGVVFGGEPAPVREVRRLTSMAHAFQAYGPTEASVCCMVATPTSDWRAGTIGRPLVPDTIGLLHEGVLHRVTSDGTTNGVTTTPMLPEGATSEIVVVGPLVAHGYLDAPSAGADRFGTLDGSRVHFTGDLAQLQDGILIWTGRRDRQVKINGRMMCPEEIETLVPTILAGARARVVVDRDRIVLFVSDVEPPSDLASTIAHALGSTFRPSLVIAIPTMPMGTTGKPDDAVLTGMIP